MFIGPGDLYGPYDRIGDAGQAGARGYLDVGNSLVGVGSDLGLPRM